MLSTYGLQATVPDAPARPGVQRRLHARHRSSSPAARSSSACCPRYVAARELLAARRLRSCSLYAGAVVAAHPRGARRPRLPQPAWRPDVPTFVRRPGARARAGDQRQPRARASTAPGSRSPCTTTSSCASTPAGPARSTSSGEGAGRLPRDERHLVVARAARGLRPARRAAARAGAALHQPHPAVARPRLVVGGDRRRPSLAARALVLDGERAARRRRACSPSPTSSRGTPTTSRPACSAG